jgi:hypothetical protein
MCAAGGKGGNTAFAFLTFSAIFGAFFLETFSAIRPLGAFFSFTDVVIRWQRRSAHCLRDTPFNLVHRNTLFPGSGARFVAFFLTQRMVALHRLFPFSQRSILTTQHKYIMRMYNALDEPNHFR